MAQAKKYQLKKLFTMRSTRPFLLFDSFLVYLVYLIGVSLSPWAGQIFASSEIYVTAGVYALTVAIVSLGLGYYSLNRRYRLFNIVANGFVAHISGGLISVAVTYLGFYTSFGRLGSIFGGLASYLFLALLKLLLRKIILNSPIKISVSGDNLLSRELKQELQKPGRLFRVEKAEVDFSNPEKSVDSLIEKKMALAVIPADRSLSGEYIDFHFKAADRGLEVVSDLEFYGHIFERYPIDLLTKDQLISFGFLKEDPLYEIAKRTLDIILGVIGLLFASPILLVIAILIKLTSKGPIFFNQPRMGQRLKPFKMFKFRTMRASESKKDASGGFTQAGDSRVTWIGKIIRPLHFDELPQILNIIKGDMSIVGVRPEAESFAEKMNKEIPFYYLRYISRPGLTGHAQISMGYALDTVEATKDKLSYDFYYLTKKSTLNDLRIILQTAFFLTAGSR